MSAALKVYQKTARIIYKFLGSRLSTRLAKTLLGRLVFKFFESGNDIYICSNDIKLKLTQSEAYRLGVLHLGIINPFETAVIKKVLRAGDIFIDVGTYVDGWHSLIASKSVGRKGKVFSFEPLYFNRFKENIAINKISNITLLNYAVSDKNGFSIFYDRLEKSSLTKTPEDLINIRTVKVKTITLDKFMRISKIKKVRLLKIDVEGSEINVIKGALKLLSSPTAPDIIIESLDSHLKHSDPGHYPLINLLKKMGFNLYEFQRDGLKNYKLNHQNGLNLYCSRTSLILS